MIRNLCIAVAIIGLGVLGLRWLLDPPHLYEVAPHLPGQESAPMLIYDVAATYRIAQDFDTAATYFKYVYTQYPASSYAEIAHVFWLECLSHSLYRNPAQAVAECEVFLDQYRNSKYAARVRTIEEACARATIH